ncbi:MAG TPA: FAD-dependent monooxygenase [Pseudonocardiaceae bacterium]
MSTVPVVIVGAGPTGLTAATLLGQYGVECLVLDRWESVYPQPRAVHLDDEIYRVLARLRLGDEFAAISRPCHGLRQLSHQSAAVKVPAADAEPICPARCAASAARARRRSSAYGHADVGSARLRAHTRASIAGTARFRAPARPGGSAVSRCARYRCRARARGRVAASWARKLTAGSTTAASNNSGHKVSYRAAIHSSK